MSTIKLTSDTFGVYTISIFESTNKSGETKYRVTVRESGSLIFTTRLEKRRNALESYKDKIKEYSKKAGG